MRGATPKAGLAQWQSRERARPGTTYATFVPNEGKGVGNGFSQVCSWVGIRKSARSPALIRLCRQHAAARQHECERWGPAQGQVAAVGIALIVEGRGREWRRLTAVCGCNHWSLSSLDGASLVALSSSPLHTLYDDVTLALASSKAKRSSPSLPSPSSSSSPLESCPIAQGWRRRGRQVARNGATTRGGGCEGNKTLACATRGVVERSVACG